MEGERAKGKTIPERGQRGHTQALMWLVEDRKFGERRIGRREDAERRGHLEVGMHT